MVNHVGGLAMKNILKFGLIAILVCCASVVAHATTIDTFSVTQIWGAPNGGGVTASASGTFTGKVGSHGLIQQADLSNFSFSYTFATEHFNFSQFQLSLFSFNADDFLSKGFTGSFDLIATTNAMNGSSSGTETLCIGAVAGEGLSPCAGNPPFSTLGSITLFGSSMDFTSTAPMITLVSSTTTMNTVPEPGSAALIITGLVGAALLMRKKQGLMVRN
jgi:hypothetical protein